MTPYELKYLLRWRFDFHDGKVKYGPWNSPGTKDDMTTKAWCVSKDGLSKAFIEGKDHATREVKPLIECDGHNFVNFEWIAACSGLRPPGVTAWTPKSVIRGLAMITRDNRVAVYINGDAIRRKRTDIERSQHLEGFGK